ncbi:GNAT family N-acetyltransferase [Kitasatospora sp. NPDC049285]|uniref:GNAT family N-acetyltransferase n=1 Tax=Kitasatospora sp. NPDC049285 TaxID=3157096 RepID=UPI00342FF3AA
MTAAPAPPRLREGSAADAPAVAALLTASRRAAYAGLVPVDALGSEEEQRLLWELRLSVDYGTPERTPVLLLAEDPDGTLAGFAYLTPEDDLVRLEQLHVRPGRTGAGLGGLLLAAALTRFADHPVRLDVLAANHRAITFYERHGARRTGTGTAHFPGGLRLPEYEYGWH